MTDIKVAAYLIYQRFIKIHKSDVHVYQNVHQKFHNKDFTILFAQ